MERYAIGLDLGTSSAKAVLLSESRGIVDKATASFIYKPAYLPDGAEYLGIDPELFYETVAGVIKNLSASIPENAEFCGIAMASASGNSILCDEDGVALIHGYSWLNKPFTEEIAAVFGEDFGKNVRERAGWGLSGSFPLGQLSHIKLHAPELLDSAGVVCMTTEYLLHRLTGKWGIDPSTATPFFFLDQKARAWNGDYLAPLGIDEKKLPPLGACGGLLGGITEEAARDTGLAAGTCVYLGSFDHPTAARACEILEEGDLLISCGTSWVCFFPMNNREQIVNNSFLCDPFLTPDGPWGAMSSLARVSEKIKEVVEKYISCGEDKFELLDMYAARSCKKTEGLVIDPMGEIPNLCGYSKESIARALMEGVARKLKERVDGIIKVKRVSMCGGPSSSEMWRKVLSEVFGVPITVTYGAHSGAAGAALYALRAR